MEPSNLNEAERARSRRFITEATIALATIVILVPPFIYPMGGKSYCAGEGTLLAVMAGLLSCHAFLWCPWRLPRAKFITLGFLLLSLPLPIWCVVAYFRFGLQR